MTDGEFRIQAGGADRTVVFLPGYATDHRIFDGIAPGATRIVPSNVAPDRMAERLFPCLRGAGIGKVVLFGWSMGAFIASEIAGKHPDSVERLVLVGARKRFDRPGLDGFRRSLEENAEACLLDFYARCFLPTHRTAYKRFRETLLPSYLAEMEAGRLMRDLDYLYGAEIRPEDLPPCPVTFVHGARDVIAPAAESLELAAAVPGAAVHVLPNAPHTAFLDGEFPHLAGIAGNV